jgi:hypothetical protein
VENEKVDSVEITETVVENTPVVTEEAISSLPAAEREMFKKHNMIPEVKEEKKEEVKVEVKEEVKEEKKEEVVEDLTPEQEKEKLQKFNPNEKALYHKWKDDKRKRQDAEASADLLKLRLKYLEQTVEELKKPKVEPVKSEILDKPDDEIITAADLKKIEEQKAEKARLEESTKKEEEVKAVEASKRRAERLEILEKRAKSKYSDYETVAGLAKEVMESDSTGIYLARFYKAVLDENPQEGTDAAEIAYSIGKLHPNYGKVVEKKEEVKEEKAEVNKIVDNLNKRTSSAAVGNGGKRVVSYDDLTLADACKLSKEQWRNLPPQVRQRLLGS